MAAFVDFVEIGQVGISTMSPRIRRTVDVFGEHGDRDRKLDLRRLPRSRARGIASTVFPVEARGRGRGVGEPIKRDVIQDFVFGGRFVRILAIVPAREAGVHEHEGGETRGRIREAIAHGLRPGAHHHEVARISTHPVGAERVEDGVLLVGQAGRRGRATQERGSHLGRHGRRQVEMDGEKSGHGLARHLAGDGSAPVSALRHEVRVAEPLHELGPYLRDVLGAPTRARWFSRKTVARDRRNDYVERVLGTSTMRRGIGQRTDDFQEFEDRAGPAVRQEKRHGVGLLGSHVDEVDVDAIDVGRELRQGVELRFRLAPVVARAPVAHELLERIELCSLGTVRDRLPIGPARLGDAAAKVRERLLGHVDAVRPDGLRGPRLGRNSGQGEDAEDAEDQESVPKDAKHGCLLAER